MPVAVLAAFGVLSLRKDRQSVESEVRERARQFADEAVERCWKRLAVTDRVDLSARSDTGTQPSALFFQISPKGGLVNPPPCSAVPIPKPLNTSLLNPRQAELWQRASTPGPAAPPIASLIETLRAFLATSPPPQFAALAHIRLAATLSSGDQLEAVREYRSVLNQFPGSVGETGLPLAPLALLQLTELTLSSSTDIRSTLDRFASNAISQPSSLTPTMLVRVAQWEQQYLNSTNLSLGWIALWDRSMQERLAFYAARQALDGLSPPERVTGAQAAYASPGPSRSAPSWPALFWFQQPVQPLPTGKEAPSADRDAEWLAAKHQQSVDGSEWFVCRDISLVRRILQEVGKAESPLPQYLGVQYQIAGRTFYETNGSRSSTNPRVLALASHVTTNGTPLLSVAISLLDPPLLYRQQRQRLFWFGMLLGVSAIVALVGLFSTWSAFRQQLRLYQLQSNFVSSVTHELRAPIGALRLTAENFKHGFIREPVEQIRFFDYLVRECCRLSSLVENVLNLARIEQGRKQYEFEPTDVVALVEDTLRLMRPVAAESVVTLDLEWDQAQFPNPPRSLCLTAAPFSKPSSI